ASVHLKRAFKQHSIQKVHRIYKTLFLSRFYNITSQLKDEFQSYLCLCGAELTQRNQSVSYSGLYTYAIAPSVINFVDLNQQLQEIFMEILTKSFHENKQIRMKLGNPFWVIPYHDVQLNRFNTFNFVDFTPVFKNEVQLYLMDWYKK